MLAFSVRKYCRHALLLAEPIRPKRSYIRTKISKEKPVNMEKLMIPFEYDWRRETRLRGISKSGKIIGEVFYYTPSDKRVRSYNDVHKYLKQVQESYKRGLTDEKGLPIGSKASEDSLVAEEERATPPISNSMSVMYSLQFKKTVFYIYDLALI